MLRKYLCVKNLCCHVIDSHNRHLQVSNCAKECQFNQAEPPEVKDNSYKLGKKPMVKVQRMATFLLTNLESCSSCSTKANIAKLHYTKRGALTKEGLSNLV